MRAERATHNTRRSDMGEQDSPLLCIAWAPPLPGHEPSRLPERKEPASPSIPMQNPRPEPPTRLQGTGVEGLRQGAQGCGRCRPRSGRGTTTCRLTSCVDSDRRLRGTDCEGGNWPLGPMLLPFSDGAASSGRPSASPAALLMADADGWPAHTIRASGPRAMKSLRQASSSRGGSCNCSCHHAVARQAHSSSSNEYRG